MRVLRCAAIVALLAAAAVAQDKPPAEKPDWRRVADAFHAKDDAAVADVAAKTKRDPWLVADDLCAHGEIDAAAAFAAAANRKGCEKLSAYVAARRAAPSADAVRKAYAAADAALRAKDSAGAIAACESVKRGDDVPSLQLAYAYAYALKASGRFDDALDAARDAEKAAESVGWPRQALRIAQLEAQLEQRHGDVLIAALTLEQSIGFAEQIGDKAAVAGQCMDAGNLFLLVPMPPKALEMEKRALAIHKELGDRGLAAGDAVNIGIVLLRGGREDEALPYLQQGLDEAAAAGRRDFAANAMGNIGLVWLVRKDYDKAVEWIEKSKKLKEELGDERALAAELMNLGGARRKQGRLDDARAAYEKGAATMERLGWKGDAAKAFSALGEIALAQKKPADAVGFYERARVLLAPTKFINLLCPVYVGLAKANEAAGNRAEAEKWYREAAIWVEGVDAEDLNDVKEGFARLGLKWGETKSAPTDDAEAEGRRRIREGERHWKAAQDALAKDDKSAAMSELRDAAAALASGDDDAQAARAKLDAAYRTGVKMGVDVDDAPTAYYFLALRRGRRLVARLDARRETPPFHGRPLSSGRAQETLRPGMAYVVFGVFDDETFAVVLTQATHSLVKLGPTKTIADACAKLDLSDASRDPTAALAEVRRLVVAPLGLTPATTRICVCAPDEPLARLPFAALAPDLEIAAMPTPETAVYMSTPERAFGEFLVVGDADEAKTWGAARLDPATTTWPQFVERLNTRRAWTFVELTGKIVPDPDDAAYTAIEFAPADGKRVADGAAIDDASVPVRALFLTGGAAGRATMTPGDGAWSLPNKFLGAGALGVVASLWTPDPAAARAFVDKFVASWKQTTSKSAAFRAAQEFVRSQPQWSHPRFWAGWVLSGLLD